MLVFFVINGLKVAHHNFVHDRYRLLVRVLGA